MEMKICTKLAESIDYIFTKVGESLVCVWAPLSQCILGIISNFLSPFYRFSPSYKVIILSDDRELIRSWRLNNRGDQMPAANIIKEFHLSPQVSNEF